MAYTRVWSSSRPPGSTVANLIDDEMQYTRKDIEERLVSITGAADLTSDPVIPAANTNAQLRSELSTAQTGITAFQTVQTLTLFFHWSAGRSEDSAIAGTGLSLKWAVQNPTGQGYTIYNDAGSAVISPIIFPLSLPLGDTITGVSAYASHNGVGGVNTTVTVFKETTTGTQTSLGTTTGSAGGAAQTVTVSGLTQVVTTAEFYYVRVTFAVVGALGPTLFGISAVYSSPDANKRV